MVMGVLLSYYISNYHDYNAVVIAPENDTYMDYVFMKPYTRCCPWGLGMACGLVLFSYRHYTQTRLKYDMLAYQIGKITVSSRLFRFTTMLVGFALTSVTVFIAFYAYRDIKDDWNDWDSSKNVAYLSLAHFTFPLGFSLIIMPLLHGHFRVLLELMSADFFVIMGRMSMIAYLIHQQLVYVFYLTGQKSFYYSVLNNILNSIVLFVLIYGLSIPIWLIS
jgi:hypothetical protein